MRLKLTEQEAKERRREQNRLSQRAFRAREKAKRQQLEAGKVPNMPAFHQTTSSEPDSHKAYSKQGRFGKRMRPNCCIVPLLQNGISSAASAPTVLCAECTKPVSDIREFIDPRILMDKEWVNDYKEQIVAECSNIRECQANLVSSKEFSESWPEIIPVFMIPFWH